jgi:hypothetical protein
MSFGCSVQVNRALELPDARSPDHNISMTISEDHLWMFQILSYLTYFLCLSKIVAFGVLDGRFWNFFVKHSAERKIAGSGGPQAIYLLTDQT